MTSETLEVRPFCSAAEYEAMIDYFLLAEDAFLCGMGGEKQASSEGRVAARGSCRS